MRSRFSLWTAFVIYLAAYFVVGCVDSSSPELLPQRASADRLKSDVRFLSDDLLEGREAGMRGYDLAALYVAEQFRAIGLEPAGDDGSFYQSVPMLEYRLDAAPSLKIGDVDLIVGEDYLVHPTGKGETVDISAPLVFGGMCFASEREGRDDFDDLDISGKIVACFDGAPKYLAGEERAHYKSTEGKRLSDLGAIGRVTIYTQTLEERFSFEDHHAWLASGGSLVNWLTDDGVPFSTSPNEQARAYLSLAGAEKLFEQAGTPWSELLTAAESETGNVTRFDFEVAASMHIESKHRRFTSDNVVAVLAGSDPELRKEHIILTAHLDHDGIRPSPEEGDDELYNGAMDNTVGVSALLEIARLLKVSPPRRSVVFIALTAEEKGFGGSDYFARHPTVPSDSMVAVINLDMPIVTYDFADIVAFGANRSTLFGPVKQAAEAHGLALSPDPAPDEGLFTRSDHYSFVKQGVPAVYVDLGFANGGDQAQTEFRKAHYHRASDEAKLVNFDALRRFTDVNADVARNIANMPDRPVWNDGDFFGSIFDGPMASD